jgi:hypothetical protein
LRRRISHSLERFTWAALICLVVLLFSASTLWEYMGSLSGAALTGFRFFIATCIVILPVFATAWLLHNHRALGNILLPPGDTALNRPGERYMRTVMVNPVVQLLICLAFLMSDMVFSIPVQVFDWVQGLTLVFSFYMLVAGYGIARARAGLDTHGQKRSAGERIRHRTIFRRIVMYGILLFSGYVTCDMLLISDTASMQNLAINDSMFVLLNIAYTLSTLYILLKMNIKIDNPDSAATVRKLQDMAATVESQPAQRNLRRSVEEDWIFGPGEEIQPSLRTSDIVGLATVIVVWLLIPFFKPEMPKNGDKTNPGKARTEKLQPARPAGSPAPGYPHATKMNAAGKDSSLPRP